MYRTRDTYFKTYNRTYFYNILLRRNGITLHTKKKKSHTLYINNAYDHHRLDELNPKSFLTGYNSLKWKVVWAGNQSSICTSFHKTVRKRPRREKKENLLLDFFCDYYIYSAALFRSNAYVILQNVQR